MAHHRSVRPELSDQPVCIHLRSKAMYVTGEMNPNHVDESESHYNDCWCNLTQHVFGPDQLQVAPKECNADRDCFRETRD